jgi:hypothetical protein
MTHQFGSLTPEVMQKLNTRLKKSAYFKIIFPTDLYPAGRLAGYNLRNEKEHLRSEIANRYCHILLNLVLR